MNRRAITISVLAAMPLAVAPTAAWARNEVALAETSRNTTVNNDGGPFLLTECHRGANDYGHGPEPENDGEGDDSDAHGNGNGHDHGHGDGRIGGPRPCEHG
jgi:hypothetical protein